jgi:RNA polymerase sigma-70 factor, ECF subfamily
MTGQSPRMSDPQLASAFERHWDEVVAYCVRRAGWTSADDLAAQVFAIACRRVDEIQWDTVRPWLYGIARGVVANHLRSLQRGRRLFDRVSLERGAEAERPDDVIVRRSEDEAVMCTLARLSDDDREILMLAAWEELTAPEIAGVLGISRTAAEQRCHRAKRRFARVLASTNASAEASKGGAR